MTDREALLRAVIANPLDDTPRLVMADWLDEHGEAELAEFIRLQCGPLGQVLEPHVCGFAHGTNACWVCKQRQRERSLLVENVGRWIPPIVGLAIWDNAYVRDTPRYGWLMKTAHSGGQQIRTEFSRGFPSKVTLPDLAAWERWGESIVRAAPVVEIVVSELEPYQEPGRHPRFFWQDAGGAVVWFNSRDSALVAAARAFADESRARAGLPPVWTREEVVR